MKPKPPSDAATQPAAGGPLADLVEDELSRPLAEQIADELAESREEQSRSGATDYAHGTAEHDDDHEAHS